MSKKKLMIEIKNLSEHVTKNNPPSHIIATKSCVNRSEASKLEYQIKQLSPIQKRALGLKWTSGMKITEG
jgi:predicted GIY-YIG superfamily endonuclease